MNLSWNGYRKFVVSRKVSECAAVNVSSLYLTPQDGRKLAPFKPGQYLTFRLNIPGQKRSIVRFYSLSDRPREDYYRVTIKKECNDPQHPGLASSYFNDVVQERDVLDVGAPDGQFFLEESSASPVVLVSAGVGITPVLSMLNSIAQAGSKREVFFIHCAPNSSGHIQKEHLETIARENPNVALHIFYSKPSAEDQTARAINGSVRYRFEKLHLETLKEFTSSSESDFYICGPGAFMKQVIANLGDCGVPKERIHEEAFSAGTVDQIAPKQVLTPWKITFAKSGTEVRWDGQSDHLLAFAESKGAEIPNICRGLGICRSCKVKIVSGEVGYRRDPKRQKSEKFWDEGYCLTCICQPKSDLVLDLGVSTADKQSSKDTEIAISPFDPATKDQLDRILDTPVFRDMPDAFRNGALRKILAQHARIRSYRQHEIIVRKGDYGTSAFLVLNGKARIVLEPDLPPSALGRPKSNRKNPFRILNQLWSSFRQPEVFSNHKPKEGFSIQAQRGEGDQVRIVLRDVVSTIKTYKIKTQRRVPGEWFGEMSALTRAPRSATAFAQTDNLELLEVRWQGLRDLMEQDSKLREHIDKIYRDRARDTARREIPLFRHLKDEALDEVIKGTEFQTYGDYDWSLDYKELAASNKRDEEEIIATEGEYPNGVFFIRAGFARLSQKFGYGNRTLNYLGAGRFYGLEEIAHNWRNTPENFVPLQYTLRVTGYTHSIFIPTHIMESLVLPAIPKKELPALVLTDDSPDSPPPAIDASARIGLETFEFLTERRFFNGTATMMIDLDRCTRCDDCVRACAATHDNNPRFLRQGPNSGRLMVANACMHCVDPVCMIGCPTGAIHRERFGGEVVINPVTCIGCAICANNCPYDAIRMVEIRARNGLFPETTKREEKFKATKCDLCVDQITGPACQRACPHGALSRINLNDLNAFAAWLKR